MTLCIIQLFTQIQRMFFRERESQRVVSFRASEVYKEYSEVGY